MCSEDVKICRSRQRLNRPIVANFHTKAPEYDSLERANWAYLLTAVPVGVSNECDIQPDATSNTVVKKQGR